MNITCSQLQGVVSQLTVLSNTSQLLPVTEYLVQLNYFIWTLCIIQLSTNYRHSLHKVIPIPMAGCRHTAFRDKYKRCLFLTFYFCLCLQVPCTLVYEWANSTAQIVCCQGNFSSKPGLAHFSLPIHSPSASCPPKSLCQLGISGFILATGDCKVTTLLSS